MSADFYITQGDRHPSLARILSDATSTINLTTAASVRFRMRRPGAPTPKVDAPAVVTEPLYGGVRYDWAVLDTDEPAIYHADFLVTWADSSTQTHPTVPMIIQIRNKVA